MTTKRTCSIEGCDRPHNSHGLCSMHGHRRARYGDPLFDARAERRRLRAEMTAKACSSCRVVKPLVEFSDDRRNADGKQGRCRSCHNLDFRQRRTPEIAAREVERHRRWRRTPAGKAARSREYEKNRTRAIARATAWNRSHPGARLEATRRRRARLAVPKGQHMTGITREKIAARWAYFGSQCWMCGAPATTSDHVKPISKGGQNLASNIRPACDPCNRFKSAAWPFDTRTRRVSIEVSRARAAIALVNVGEFDERRFRVQLRRLSA